MVALEQFMQIQIRFTAAGWLGYNGKDGINKKNYMIGKQILGRRVG